MADSVGGSFPTTGMQIGHTFSDIDDGTLWKYVGGLGILVSSWVLFQGKVEVDPNTALWGVKQAGAFWYNTTEKEYKGWDGTQKVAFYGVQPESGANTSRYDISDEFIEEGVGQAVSGLFLNASGGGTSTNIAGLINHPGLWTVDTGAGPADASFRYSSNCLHMSEFFTLTSIIRPNNVDANTAYRFGLTSVFGGTIGMYIEKRAADVNWQMTCSDGVGTTRIDSGIPIVAGDFYKLNVRRISVSRIGLSINNSTETVISSDLPSIKGSVEILVSTTVAAAKSYTIDYFRFSLRQLGR